MKLIKLAGLLGSGLFLTVAVVGCKHQDYGVTKLPAGAAGTGAGGETKVSDAGKAGTTDDVTGKPVPLSAPGEREKWPRDREIFKADTIHFDYDKSAVKGADKPKVEAVATYLKANPLDAVEIEGHADERGTEEYNRALGERRALALRDELIRLGIDGSRVDTVTFGKDKPVDTGHDEAAHRKNRRGEFVLEMHPK